MPDVDTADAAAAASALREKCPAPGSRWRHVKTATVYEVCCGVVLEATVTPAVVYVKSPSPGEYHGPWWVRPLDLFLDGRFVRVDDGAPT